MVLKEQLTLRVNSQEEVSDDRLVKRSASVALNPPISPNAVLDGLTGGDALRSVVRRVLLVSAAYTVASSMFIAAFVNAFHITLFGLGPLSMAVLNAISIVYFVGIMLPFSILLAWIFRYRKHAPYQQRSLLLDIPESEAFQIAMGAGLSVGGNMTEADQFGGKIAWLVPPYKDATKQELTVQIQPVNAEQSLVTVTSAPTLNPIESLLFGYTLSVDGGRNKWNVESVLLFLRQNQGE